jgi:hypothetical protein
LGLSGEEVMADSTLGVMPGTDRGEVEKWGMPLIVVDFNRERVESTTIHVIKLLSLTSIVVVIG